VDVDWSESVHTCHTVVDEYRAVVAAAVDAADILDTA